MRSSMSRSLCFFACLFALLSAPFAAAQDARGLITGIVTDPSGAVIPGAKITAVADASGVATATTANDTGNYALLYLVPGTYAVRVEATGFRTLVRQGIEVRVGDELKINLVLTMGTVSSEVTVTADAPIIESQSADVGVTMTKQQIADLPLSDGNPFTLARLVPGAVFTGSPLYARPFDNSDVSALRVNGAEGQINFTLNGTPNTGHQIGHGDPVLSYMPPAEALQEFKMTTSSFDAANGHSAAASVNISTKSGGNAFHGGVYEQNRNEALSAEDFFANNLGRPKPITRLNHFGAFISGPVVIPKFYNGHKKTFFSFNTDHMIDSFPSSNSDATVPTLGMKGVDSNHKDLPYFDFGSLCQAGFDSTGVCQDRSSSGTVLHQIYNPFTTVYQKGSTSNVTRSPFPYNQIPRSLVSPIALKVINFYPDPNQQGNADGTHNYYSQNLRNDWFHSYMVRIDHVLSSRQTLNGSYQQNWRLESRDNPFGVVHNPLLDVSMPPLGNNLYYINHGGQIGDTLTLSGRTYLDVRFGYSRFQDKRRPQVLGLDPTTLGLPAAPIQTVKQETGVQNFMPYFRIYGFNNLGNANSRYMDAITNSYNTNATLTRMMGVHMFKMGYEARLFREGAVSLGDAMGYYEFRESYAEQTNKSSAEQGQGLATFLLGLPYSNSSRMDINTSTAHQVLWQALFFQDDWKIKPNLTLNLGLRYEYEGAPTERYNQNTLGFDLASPSAMSAAVSSAFQRLYPTGSYLPSASACSTTSPCPMPSISLAGWQAVGGYLFANGDHRSFYHVNPWNFQPRFGVAYAIRPHTVVRGGVGLYAVPVSPNSSIQSGVSGAPGFNPAGYSQRTQAAYSTQNNGMNFNPANCTANPALCPAGMATLTNPFPNGLTMPSGSSYGLMTALGQGIDITPLAPGIDPRLGKSLAWSFDIQQELPGRWGVTLNYSGRKGWNLARSSNYLNAIPAKYFTTEPLNTPAMQAWDAEMKLNVPNPFQGQGVGGPTNGGFNNGLPTASTIALNQLLRPYPQFGDVKTSLYNGANNYEGASVMVDHRFHHGYQLYLTYTFSKLIEDYGYLNDWETRPQHNLSGNDVPQRVTMTFIGEVPIGRQRKFFNSLPRWADAVAGGWQTGIVFQAQTGMIPSWGDVYYNGDPSKLRVNLDASNIARGGGFSSSGTPVNGQVFDVSGFYPSGGSACRQQLGSPVAASSSLCYGDPLIKLSSYHVQTFPRNLPNFRNPGQNNWDINAVKKFRVTESVSYEVRADFLNAFNHPWFNSITVDPTSSNFGKITSQKNLPRNLQIGMKLLF